MENKLQEVLKANRYGIKDLAEWLGTSYQATWKKVKGKTEWTLSDIKTIQSKLGVKNTNYIFFSNDVHKIEQ